MTDPTPNERVNSAADLAAAARDSTMEKLEGAKGHLADGAERLAAAVDRTADNLAAEGDDTVSGFGRSLSGLMRQLAGGLRERDIEQFARELGTMARRNPGVFLAGSVALGFGVARFFKARPPRAQSDYVRRDWQDADAASADTIDDDTQESWTSRRLPLELRGGLTVITPPPVLRAKAGHNLPHRKPTTAAQPRRVPATKRLRSRNAQLRPTRRAT